MNLNLAYDELIYQQKKENLKIATYFMFDVCFLVSDWIGWIGFRFWVLDLIRDVGNCSLCLS